MNISHRNCGCVAAVLAFALAAFAQSDLLPEILLLSKIKRQARQDLTRIPNFTCLETIERTSRNSVSKPFSPVDVILVEVAHAGDRELFAWPGASRFENPNLGAMISSGLISNGEFVSHARTVFLGDYGVVRYAGMEEVRGRQAARYDYETSAAFSGYTVHNAGREAVVGVKGSFWGDSISFDLLRLTAIATNISADVGVRRVFTEVDYSRNRIGTGDYLLPQAATVEIDLDTGLEQRNRIEFTHCRQYSSESVLSFNDPDVELARGPVSPTPGRIVEVVLPPDLMVAVVLETPIHLDRARIGEDISAVLDSDLSRKGHPIAPKGAVISGRVRMVQREKSGYTMGLEFTDLSFAKGHARFVAKLINVDSRYAQSEFAQEPTRSSGIQLDLPMALPGVATFFVPARITELPKGMIMQWKTMAVGK
jgi:hypothetical protein